MVPKQVGFDGLKSWNDVDQANPCPESEWDNEGVFQSQVEDGSVTGGFRVEAVDD